MEKKSLTGYCYIDWHLNFEKCSVMGIPLVVHTHITNSSINCPVNSYFVM